MADVIKLHSSSNTVVVTTLEAAMMSGTIKEALISSDDDQNREIHVNVPGDSLELAVEWMEHHQNEEQPTRDEILDKPSEVISDWDQSFFKTLSLDEIYCLVSYEAEDFHDFYLLI
jgi:hypothetical protein